MFIYKRRRTSQPQAFTGLDESNPLSRGVVGLIIGNAPIEVINRITPTLSGAAVYANGPGGYGRNFPNENSNYEQYAGAWSRPSGQVSHLTVFSMSAIPTVSARLSGNFQTSTNGYGIIPNNTNIRYSTARSGANSTINGTAPVANRLYAVLGVTNATNNSLYENGRRTAGPTAHGGWTAATGNFRLGLDSGGGGAACRSTIYLSVVWNRELTEGEAVAITSNPWQILSPEIRANIFDMGGGGAIVLTGNDCAQPNTSTDGAISQTHVLTGNNCAQANTSTTGAITQTHILDGNDCAQPNTSTTGAISQTHVLTGNNCAQANTSTTGAISQGIILTGANCAQVNTSTSGAISQTHVLAGANCAQTNTSTSGAVFTGIVLTGNNCAQTNTSTTGVITQTHILSGANCRQRNTSGYLRQRITRPGVTISGDIRAVSVTTSPRRVTLSGDARGVNIGMDS